MRRPSSTILRLGEAGQRRHAIGRELEDALAERLPADGVRGQILVVLRVHVDDHPQQPERQRGVGAGERRQVLVGALGRARAQRVDRHHVRAALARREHELPQVVAARQRVRAPQQDQVGLGERLRVHPGGGPGRVAGAPRPRHRAGRHPVMRGAEDVPEPLPGAALQSLDVAERARALERPDRLAAPFRADLVQPFGDLGQRVVPRDPLEATLALGADALERMQEPVRRARVIEVAVDLGAQRAGGEGMVAVAAQADGLARPRP